MDVEDVEKGRQFKAAILNEIATIEQRLRQLKKFASDLDSLLKSTESTESTHEDVGYVGASHVVNGEEINPSERKSRPDQIEGILRSRNNPATTTELAEALIARGDGKGMDRHRFWRIIDSALRSGVKNGRFKKMGRATWTLGNRATSRPTGNTAKGLPSSIALVPSTWAQLAADVIKGHGGNLSVAEIMKGIAALGHEELTLKKNAYNSVYSAMLRSKYPRFQRLDDSTWTLVKPTTKPVSVS